jgi:hypothetical protein
MSVANILFTTIFLKAMNEFNGWSNNNLIIYLNKPDKIECQSVDENNCLARYERMTWHENFLIQIYHYR